MSRRKDRVIGLLTEIDTALSMGTAKALSIGLVLESDSVFVMSGTKARALGLVSETDVPLAMLPGTVVVVTNLVQRDARFQVKLLRTGRFGKTVSRDAKF